MKNFTYLLAAALLSTSAAFAQSAIVQEPSLGARSARSITAKSDQASPFVAYSMDGNNAVAQQAPSNVAIPTFPTDDPVTETPEGTLFKNYMRKGYSFFNPGFGIYYTTVDGTLGSYVEAPDGTIWLARAISRLSTGYLRLDKQSEGHYVAKTPQTIYSLEGNVYYATRLTLHETTNGFSYSLDSIDVDTVDTDMAFTYQDGVLKQVNTETVEYGGKQYPIELLALTDRAARWYGYGDAQIEVAPCTEVAAVLPSSVTLQDYLLTTRSLESDGTVSTNSQIVSCGIDGNDFYLNDPYHNADNMWAKGSIDGNSLTFPSQYVGVDEDNFRHVWFLPTSYSYAYVEDYESYTTVNKFISSLNFTLDEATNTYVAADSTGFAINGNPNTLIYFGVYSQPTLMPYYDVPATPADPSFDSIDPYDEESGMGAFAVNIPSTSVDGSFLNTEKLFFNIFFDSPNAETFSPDEYTELTDDLTDIPYGFTDEWDFYASGDLHTIYFYTAAENVGVQSFYTGGGETHRSNMVWYPEVPTSVKGLDNGTANVKSETFYDLQGRRLNTPVHGINLKVTTYADGSKHTSKVLK